MTEFFPIGVRRITAATPKGSPATRGEQWVWMSMIGMAADHTRSRRDFCPHRLLTDDGATVQGGTDQRLPSSRVNPTFKVT